MKSVIIEKQSVYIKFHNNGVTIQTAMLALKVTIQHYYQIASSLSTKCACKISGITTHKTMPALQKNQCELLMIRSVCKIKVKSSYSGESLSSVVFVVLD